MPEPVGIAANRANLLSADGSSGSNKEDEGTKIRPRSTAELDFYMAPPAKGLPASQETKWKRSMLKRLTGWGKRDPFYAAAALALVRTRRPDLARQLLQQLRSRLNSVSWNIIGATATATTLTAPAGMSHSQNDVMLASFLLAAGRLQHALPATCSDMSHCGSQVAEWIQELLNEPTVHGPDGSTWRAGTVSCHDSHGGVGSCKIGYQRSRIQQARVEPAYSFDEVSRLGEDMEPAPSPVLQAGAREIMRWFKEPSGPLHDFMETLREQFPGGIRPKLSIMQDNHEPPYYVIELRTHRPATPPDIGTIAHLQQLLLVRARKSHYDAASRVRIETLTDNLLLDGPAAVKISL